MKAEFINPIVKGASEVLKTVLQSEAKLGQLSARPTVFTTKEFNVVCGITGSLTGQVIYSFGNDSVNAISKAMLGGLDIETTDELVTSTLAELGNMISGSVSSQLAGVGYTCDITPPTIIKGKEVTISTVDIPALVIPLDLPSFGTIELNVSLKDRAVATAAA